LRRTDYRCGFHLGVAEGSSGLQQIGGKPAFSPGGWRTPSNPTDPGQQDYQTLEVAQTLCGLVDLTRESVAGRHERHEHIAFETKSLIWITVIVHKPPAIHQQGMDTPSPISTGQLTFLGAFDPLSAIRVSLRFLRGENSPVTATQRREWPLLCTERPIIRPKNVAQVCGGCY
jgi:hypothetical protein